MKTKKTVKKVIKKSHLTPDQRVKFLNELYAYVLWRENNEDLVDPYVLEVNLELPSEPPKRIKKRKVYHFSPKRMVKRLKKAHSRVFKFVSFAVVGLLAVVIVQLLYPSGRTTPFAGLQSYGQLGFSDYDKVLSKLSDFDQRIVTVHTHTKNITTSYKDLGVTIDADLTAKQMTDYPLSKRLVPFTIFFHSNNHKIVRNIDDSQLQLFVKDVVALASKKPIDALVSITGTKLSFSASEEGHEYQNQSLKSVVLKSDLGNNAQIVFTPTILYPAISSSVAEANVKRMQLRINNPITIKAEDKTRTIDSSTIASWVDIVHKPDKNTVEIMFSQDRISTTIVDLPAEVDYSAIPNITTMLNGSKVGYTQGQSGRSLQFNELVKQIADTTNPSGSNIVASVITLVPADVIDRKYTKDSTGMQSLLEYWITTNSGQYGIDFRTVNSRISANINPNRLFPSVGIYRIYIASMIYGRLSSGSTKLGDVTQNGQTVDACLSKMVIESDESCTNALGSIIEWSVADQMLMNQGFESTTLVQGASLTTANDASDWLLKLISGNITQFSQANSMTNLMSQQIFRQGIPAGSSGVRVADKAGSFGRNTNDVGIVYHPGGTYILSVMSEGSSFGKIADLTREINKVMGQ